MSARLSGSYLRDQPLLRLISFGRAIDPVMIGGTEFAHEEAGFLLLGHVLAVVAGLVDQRVLVVLRGVVRLVHRPVGFRPGCRRPPARRPRRSRAPAPQRSRAPRPRRSRGPLAHRALALRVRQVRRARRPWVPRRRSPRLPRSWPPAAPPPTARCSSPPGCRSRRRSW